MPNKDIAFTFWAKPEIKEAVKRLAGTTGRTLQALMIEALEDLLLKHGKKPPVRGGRSGAPT
jgi:hypothetical protein